MSEITIAGNLAEIRKSIREACSKYGRSPDSVRLLAVSKTFPASDIEEACHAGQLMFGENHTQELEVKVPVLAPEIQWHLIGHLQSNKAAKAVKYAHWIHSVDSMKILEKLERCAQEAGRSLNILLEANLSGEESKTGICGEEELRRITARALELKCLKLCGYMTMAEAGLPEAELRRTFARMRMLRDGFEQEFGVTLPELSMGMSADYIPAIAEGATIVRIGTAVFGGRFYPDKQ